MKLERLDTINMSNSTTLRILKKDAYKLSDIKAYTGLSMCRLIHMAIPLLMAKLGIKGEDKGE